MIQSQDNKVNVHGCACEAVIECSVIFSFQIERQAFEYTINQLNSMYIEAETLSSRTYCESCFACLTAYLAYLCMETHYEKVSTHPKPIKFNMRSILFVLYVH